MILSLHDPRVNAALNSIIEKHGKLTSTEMAELLENQYHCKISYKDPLGVVDGHIEISEEKYQNWFILSFGDDQI